MFNESYVNKYKNNLNKTLNKCLFKSLKTKDNYITSVRTKIKP